MKNINEKRLEFTRRLCNVFHIVIAVMIVIDVVLLIISLEKLLSLEKFNIGLIGGFSFGTAVLLSATILIENKLLKKLKYVLFNKLSVNVKEFKYLPDSGLPLQTFQMTNFLKDYNYYASREYIEGILKNEKKFAMSSTLVKKKVVDKAGDVREFVFFDGIFGYVDANNLYNFDLSILPDIQNKYVNKISSDLKKITYSDKNTVKLENPEFERYFDVESSNQIEARKILTLKFMEELLELRKKLKHNISVIYKSKRIYFFIEKGKIIKDRELMKYGISNESIQIATDNINKICETVNLL